MSQHDFVIDNQVGASFRADLNDALLAIASKSSAASAPSITYPYMWWADTSAEKLKLRNSINTAWVIIGDLDAENFGLSAAGKADLAGATFTGEVTHEADLIMSGAMLELDKGADVASATTTNIWSTDGNLRHITGTTTIASLGTAPQAGAVMNVIFDGALTLTQSANLNLNGGGSDVTTEAGDIGIAVADTTTQIDLFIIRKSGSSVFTRSMVRLNTANGYGSTNTKIRRFTNTVTNQGSDITYADSPTLGASFTINTSGLYSISYSDSFSNADNLGISINSTQLTSDINDIDVADRIISTNTSANNVTASVSVTTILASGDVVRAHASISSGTIVDRTVFIITRIG
jgi:hypothetical protein